MFILICFSALVLIYIHTILVKLYFRLKNKKWKIDFYLVQWNWTRKLLLIKIWLIHIPTSAFLSNFNSARTLCELNVITIHFFIYFEYIKAINKNKLQYQLQYLLSSFFSFILKFKILARKLMFVTDILLITSHIITSNYHVVWHGKTKKKKPCQSRSKIKVMLTVFFDYRGVFFDYRGVVHKEFLPTGQTINKAFKCYASIAWRYSSKASWFVD